MATQSLYRRYRPRRFGDLKGQDHVVRALRDAVREGREGQAYLFSGPRGTGKTSSARILAKVLNCERPIDGEPCCECGSCLEVERGTSYDVHELDAASNNGVENIRDLIEKSALGTPGRHKVYILDEVHMLSRAAEAALLKTLEEPPDHVVFVLATTDPQKMSDTVRSRTQHLHFHLLGPEALEQHVRWVAADAGIELSDEAFGAVIQQGNGSVRDSLSALELIAATGGEFMDRVDVDALTIALNDRDTSAALQAVATAASAGFEARPITEALIRHLRDSFLSLMAPDLVMLPADRVAEIADRAREMGPAALVRALERLGTALIEMRSSPDPRILLEVALIQLTHDEVGEDLESLAARVARVENALRATPAPAAPTTAPVPIDPTTKRAQLGGRARRDPAPAPTPEPAPNGAAEPAAAQDTQDAPADPAPATATATTPDPSPAPAPEPSTTEPAPEPSLEPTPAAQPAGNLDTVPDIWAERVRGTLKPFVRALYSAGSFDHHDSEVWYFSVPNPAHADKCQEHLATVQQALSEAAGFDVRLVITPTGSGETNPRGITRPSAAAIADADTGSAGSPSSDPSAPTPRPAEPIDEIVDPSELTDVPPEDVLDPIQRVAQKFPGSELIDSDDGAG